MQGEWIVRRRWWWWGWWILLRMLVILVTKGNERRLEVERFSLFLCSWFMRWFETQKQLNDKKEGNGIMVNGYDYCRLSFQGVKNLRLATGVGAVPVLVPDHVVVVVAAGGYHPNLDRNLLHRPRYHRVQTDSLTVIKPYYPILNDDFLVALHDDVDDVVSGSYHPYHHHHFQHASYTDSHQRLDPRFDPRPKIYPCNITIDKRLKDQTSRFLKSPRRKEQPPEGISVVSLDPRPRVSSRLKECKTNFPWLPKRT